MIPAGLRHHTAALGLSIVLLLRPDVVAAQAEAPADRTASDKADVATFLAGAGVGLLIHEGGHLVWDAIFDAQPSGLGVPEPAIGALVMGPAILDIYRYYRPTPGGPSGRRELWPPAPSLCSSGRRVSLDRALAESSLFVQLSREWSIVVNAFATFQPLDFISEVAIGSAAGLTYDPPAKALYGVSAHYRF